MTRYCLFFLVLIPTLSAAQFNDSIDYYAYYQSTGTFNKTNDQRSFVFNNIFKFSVSKKQVSLNTNNGWLFGKQNGTKINNDFYSTLEADFLKKTNKLYYWVMGTFDKSYSLQIDNRFQAGAGIGWTIRDGNNIQLVISDGFIYERGNLNDPELGEQNYDVWRNSVRLKFHWDITEVLILDGTCFYQPSLSDWKDYIIKSNTTLAFKIKNWLRITSALTYNKVTLTQRENLLVTYGIILENYF